MLASLPSISSSRKRRQTTQRWKPLPMKCWRTACAQGIHRCSRGCAFAATLIALTGK
ncbi:Uncharacterised protein [Bordetella pertussis]|nr:Uncharacterised protein [Bordetella pertussis]